MARSKKLQPPPATVERVAALKRQIEGLETIVTESKAAKQLSAATKAQVEIGRLSELLVRAEAEVACAIRGESELDRIVRLRAGASAGGSWVAVARLESEERALRARLNAEASAKAEPSVSEDELLDQILGVIGGLPESALIRIKAAVDDALGVPAQGATGLRLVSSAE